MKISAKYGIFVFYIYPKKLKILMNLSNNLCPLIVFRTANPKVLRMAGFVSVLSSLEGLCSFLKRVKLSCNKINSIHQIRFLGEKKILVILFCIGSWFTWFVFDWFFFIFILQTSTCHSNMSNSIINWSNIGLFLF